MEEAVAKNIMKIALLFSFVVYLYFLSKNIYFYVVTIKRWIKAEAEIIDFISNYDDGGEYLTNRVLYEFEYNSEIYEGNYNTNEENSRHKIGKKIIITFNPNNPSKSVIEDEFDLMDVLIPAPIFIIGYYVLF